MDELKCPFAFRDMTCEEFQRRGGIAGFLRRLADVVGDDVVFGDDEEEALE